MTDETDLGEFIDAHLKQKGAVSLSTPEDGQTLVILTTEILRALLEWSEVTGSVCIAIRREVLS